MISIKNPREIQLILEGGEKLSMVMKKVLENIKPGTVASDLDKIADEEITRLGGQAAFKIVEDYKWATCISINDEVVHGIPTKRALKEGDIVGIDMGVYYNGFNTDMSHTVEVKSPHFAKASRGKQKLEVKSEDDLFLEVGEKALQEAIKQVKPGNYIGDISKTINEIITSAGYSPVRALSGHGVGRKLHEDPMIPCFWDKRQNRSDTPLIKEGMVLAIEVIYNKGTSDLVLMNDGWTIKTKDGKISGLFEKTVAVKANGPLILTA